MHTFNVKCIMCGNDFTINVKKEDFEKWIRFANVQDAFPYLNPDERELLISNVCGECFDCAFSEDYEDVAKV